MTLPASSLILPWNLCLSANLLCGSTLIALSLIRSDLGSSCVSEESPDAAFFASLSAALLPGMPLCPGDHLIISFLPSL